MSKENVWPFISNDVTQMLSTFMDVHMMWNLSVYLHFDDGSQRTKQQNIAIVISSKNPNHTHTQRTHGNGMKMLLPLDTFHFLCMETVFVTESLKPFRRLVYFNMRKAMSKTPMFIIIKRQKKTWKRLKHLISNIEPNFIIGNGSWLIYISFENKIQRWWWRWPNEG